MLLNKPPNIMQCTHQTGGWVPAMLKSFRCRRGFDISVGLEPDSRFSSDSAGPLRRASKNADCKGMIGLPLTSTFTVFE